MALAGVTITWGQSGNGQGTTTLLGPALASETIASPGQSTTAAPGGCSTLSIDAQAAIYYAVGKGVNITATPAPPSRYLDPSFGGKDVLCKPGDTVVGKSANADAMAALVAGVVPEVTVVPTVGNHGDASNGTVAIANAIVAFYARYKS